MSKINVAIVDDNERMVHLLDNILKTDENIQVVGSSVGRHFRSVGDQGKGAGYCPAGSDYA